MLNICIPIYNRDVHELVNAVSAQAAALDGGIRVVCIDDGSELRYRELNRDLSQCCKYVELSHNVGRSRVRNLFLDQVEEDCDQMLFMDCDLKVVDDHFVERYVAEAAKGAQVVVGSHIYPKRCPGREYHLHYTNGTERVAKSSEERRRHPNRSFMTGNFMISRELLRRIPFDEAIVGYGHEDTLMGYRLQQAGVAITHIDNPLLAEDLDTNEEFLQKTRTSISNLVEISERLNDPDFDSQVTLLRVGRRVRRLHIDGLLRVLLRRRMPKWEALFKEGRGTTKQLLAYKLGVLLCMEARS